MATLDSWLPSRIQPEVVPRPKAPKKLPEACQPQPVAIASARQTSSIFSEESVPTKL